MKIIQTMTDLAAWRDSQIGRRVAFVPTMGALHEGHVSLIRKARQIVGNSGSVIVSIFVNPIQFAPNEDLTTYPRPLAEDTLICHNAGADSLYLPGAKDMYAPDRSVTVHENLISQHLCGHARPGHFDGVCTVVLKLFHRIHPTDSVFGKKDAQQLAIIRRMVRDLDIPITIHTVDTLRESDGLALSSRNRYLNAEERAQAPTLRRALLQTLLLLQSGETNTAALLAAAAETLAANAPLSRIDYLTIVDSNTFQPIDIIQKPALLAAALFLGKTRLIDNVDLHP